MTSWFSPSSIQGSFSQSSSLSVDAAQATTSLVPPPPSHTEDMLPNTDMRVGRVEEPTPTSQPAQPPEPAPTTSSPTAGESAASLTPTVQVSREPEVVKEEESVVTPDEVLPTFDKWSEQYIAEQEKQKVETGETINSISQGWQI